MGLSVRDDGEGGAVGREGGEVAGDGDLEGFEGCDGDWGGGGWVRLVWFAGVSVVVEGEREDGGCCVWRGNEGIHASFDGGVR